MSRFVRSMKEIRKSFVHERFSETGRPDSLGQENIDTWLEVQRAVNFPDVTLDGDALIWGGRSLADLTRLLKPYITGDPLEWLSAAGTVYWPAIEGTSCVFHRGVSKIFSRGGSGVFAALSPGADIRCGSVCIVVAINRAQFSLHCERVDGSVVVVVTPVRECDVLDVLLATWAVGGTEESARAQRSLCDLLGMAIGRVRRAAEDDFNCAVAVSEDGKKIVHADEVTVVKEDRSGFWVFQGTRFHNHSHILFDAPKFGKKYTHNGADYPASQFTNTDEQRARICSLLGQPDIHQWLTRHYIDKVGMDRKKFHRFLTMQRFCPDPLPEGGRYVDIPVPV